MLLQATLLIISLVILYFGAEWVLEGAEKIGLFLGFSPLVIGLVIVGFGTSLPEFFVSHLAGLRATPEIALGNIIGSNIANLFLVLGVAGLMARLVMVGEAIRDQVYLHFGVTFGLLVAVSQPALNWWSSLLLLSFFFGFLFWAYRDMRKQRQLRAVDLDDSKGETVKLSIKEYLLLVVGFLFLFGGGELLVNSGSKLGELAGVSPYIISAIFVAFGTSFPELITAIMACVKKKNTDIIVGNILGSNIFNVAFVMGTMGIHDVPIVGSYVVELSVLIFASFFMMGLSFFKRRFYRFSGILFLLIYVGVIFHWVTHTSPV